MPCNRKWNLFFAIALVILEKALFKSTADTASLGHTNNILKTGQVESKQDAEAAYFQCYDVFLDRVYNTYHENCLARKKLNLCKDKVKAAFPKIEYFVIPAMEMSAEYFVTYWCTYKPPKYWPVEALYYKYMHCPFVEVQFMVIPIDYFPLVRLRYLRATFANSLLKSVNVNTLTMWHLKHKYGNQSHPVYQALSSGQCAWHQHIQYKAKIVDKYCIVGDIYRDVEEKLAQFEQHEQGLYNWTSSMCTSDQEDSVEAVLRICDLEPWLKLQLNTSLDQCHANNVAVSGAICIIIFYTHMPPFSDIHLFMPGFCKPIKELHQCWDEVLQMCPKQALNSDMDVLIKLHQLACDLSLQDSSLVWDIIYHWSEIMKQIKVSQLIMQDMASYMYQIRDVLMVNTSVIPLPFAATLNMTLKARPSSSSEIQRILQEAVFYMDRINILYTYRFQGLNVLHAMFRIKKDVACLISSAIFAPLELFLTVGGFIDYDPNNFAQWKGKKK